eukprot:2366687-Amphidinium_carterae.1
MAKTLPLTIRIRLLAFLGLGLCTRQATKGCHLPICRGVVPWVWFRTHHLKNVSEPCCAKYSAAL